MTKYKNMFSKDSELLSIKICLVKVTLEIGQENYLFLILFQKANPWNYKNKYLNRKKKMIGSLNSC